VLCNNPLSPEGSLRFTLTPGGGMERVAGTHQRGSYGLAIRSPLSVNFAGGARRAAAIEHGAPRVTCLEGGGVPLPFAGGCLPFPSPVAGLNCGRRSLRPRAWENACAGSAAGRVNAASSCSKPPRRSAGAPHELATRRSLRARRARAPFASFARCPGNALAREFDFIRGRNHGGYNCITAQNHIALIGQSSIVAAARSRWP
jgi:hypothetical protein